MQEPPRQPSGCLEAWVITRAMFSVMVWPLVALVGAVLAMNLLGEGLREILDPRLRTARATPLPSA